MTANPPIIETARLILRPLDLWDADAVQVLFPRWEIVKFLAAVPWPYPADGALSYILTAHLRGERTCGHARVKRNGIGRSVPRPSRQG